MRVYVGDDARRVQSRGLESNVARPTKGDECRECRRHRVSGAGGAGDSCFRGRAEMDVSIGTDKGTPMSVGEHYVARAEGPERMQEGG